MGEKTIEKLIYLLMGIVLLGSVLGVSTEIINVIIELFVKYILIGAIMSFIVGNLVENISKDYLKTIMLNFKVFGIKFSVSAFLITVVILKLIVFKI